MSSTISRTLLRQVQNQRSGSRLVIHDRLLRDDPMLPTAERALIGLRNLAHGTADAKEIAAKIMWDCRNGLALIGPCGELSQRLAGEMLEPEAVWREKVQRWAFWLDVKDDIDLDLAADGRAIDAEIELVTQLSRAAAAPAGEELEELKAAVVQRSYKPFVQQTAEALFRAGEEASVLQVRGWLSSWAGNLDGMVREAYDVLPMRVTVGQLKQALWEIDFARTDMHDDGSWETTIHGPFGANLIAQLFPDTIQLFDEIVKKGTNGSWGWRKRALQRFAAECRRQLRALSQ